MKSIRSKAPLRIGLAGGGTDVSPYSNEFGGAVLNATINMYAYCFINERDDGKIKLRSHDYNLEATYPLAEQLPIDGTLDLFKYIYNRLVKEFNPQIEAFTLITNSEAPYGSGLGGSSTMVVAIIKSFVEYWKLPLNEYRIAQLAYEVERKDAMLKGGKQDQYAATFGGLNFMEFYRDRVIVNPLRINKTVTNELECTLILCNMGRSRESGSIIESQISNIHKNDSYALDAMHQAKQDAIEMKELILTGNLNKLGVLLENSWLNKKKMSSLITNNEIELIYQFAKENGATGGKVSGAGGGGYLLLTVDPTNQFDLIKKLNQIGKFATKVTLPMNGAVSWTV